MHQKRSVYQVENIAETNLSLPSLQRARNYANPNATKII